MPPRLVLIGTGGTIASTAASANTLTDYRVTQGIEAMLASIPGAASLASIRCEQPFNVDSRNLQSGQVLRLARRVARHAASDTTDGIVITHGTDTLEETAFFLHLTVRTAKPIILTGAMRPASALSADGPLNLYNALLTARDPSSHGRGILVVFNDLILAADRLTKLSTTQVQAFGADGDGVLGNIADGTVHYSARPDPPAVAPFPLTGVRHLPAVDIILDYQDAALHPYDAAIAAGSGGIVVAGMGNGSLSPAAQRGCARAHRHGLICIRASRVPNGRVTPKEAVDEAGPLAACRLNPLQARILLRLALAAGWSRAQVAGALHVL